VGNKPRNWTKLKVGNPAIYKIHVKGHLDESWSKKLCDFQITSIRMEDGSEETMLIGRISDQASLTGILVALSDMQLPVLNVDCLDADA